MHPRSIHWTCPECTERIAVGTHMSTKSNAARATVAVEVIPDLADAWAHVWTHQLGGTSPASESEGLR